LQYVLSGATASSTTIFAGGAEVVVSGGLARTTTISGGDVELGAGNAIGSGTITFAGGGELKLDQSAAFTGLISGFALPDILDLADISFGPSTSATFVEAGNNTVGTLTVTDGMHTANLILLGQYMTSQFHLTTDGLGGTLITDPPVAAMSTTHTDALLWQPTNSEVLTGSPSTAEPRGSGFGSPALTNDTWVGGDPTHLLWQPANSDGIAGGFLETASAGTLGWTMHQPSLGV
jgi:autotransporter passenger strand-loop-strand repeat protein